ncbi:MAG: hypothetical protein AAB553_04995 [Patescibacteria group bacterium]
MKEVRDFRNPFEPGTGEIPKWKRRITKWSFDRKFDNVFKKNANNVREVQAGIKTIYFFLGERPEDDAIMLSSGVSREIEVSIVNPRVDTCYSSDNSSVRRQDSDGGPPGSSPLANPQHPPNQHSPTQRVADTIGADELRRDVGLDDQPIRHVEVRKLFQLIRKATSHS